MRSDNQNQKQWDAAAYDDKHSFVWKYGLEMISLLVPRPGEKILDLGCGTGHLTNRIAQSGADVVGVDVSEAMIQQARENFPQLRFEIGDGRDLAYSEFFDAVFSNAAIHWMDRPETVARSICRSLKSGGRFVAEFGGRGNVEAIHDELYRALQALGCAPPPEDNFRYYPTIGEYATLLERAGLCVTSAVYFDRPTPLEGGEKGLQNWLEMFASNFLKVVPSGLHEKVISAVEQGLRRHLFRAGTWYADYKRIRVVAVKIQPEPTPEVTVSKVS